MTTLQKHNEEQDDTRNVITKNDAHAQARWFLASHVAKKLHLREEMVEQIVETTWLVYLNISSQLILKILY